MYLKVIVSAGAKKEKIEKVKNGGLAISVREPARQNLANKRVREILAEHFGVPLSSVRLLSGHRSPRKLFSIEKSSNE